MNPDQLTEEQRLDALKFVSQTHRSCFEQRLQRSNRALISVVGFYLLCVGGRFSASTSPGFLTTIQKPYVVAVVWGVFLLVAAITYYSLRNYGRADQVNQGIAERAENAIIDMIHSTAVPLVPAHSRHTNPNRPDFRLKGLVVFLFAVAAAFIVTIP